MCGIAGIFHYRSSKQPDRQVLSGMLERIRHRGPDESGVYLNNNLGLGHVRLSILDLKTGSQPMPDESNNFRIVFNGEIFNYIELKDELKEKGYRFRTTSDTEVLLQLYKEYGRDCLEKLNGQFAFVIWDKRKQELFVARDRVGIRPLYYTLQRNTFIFASEIKAILEATQEEPLISPRSLSQIFTFWTTLSPSTIFENIFEVPPGSYMTVSHKGIRIQPYWHLQFPEKGEEPQISLSGAIEELETLYRDAVRLRLRADVPVGAYLSGGIDSSITTSFIKNVFPERLRTFSIGFTEKEFDESAYQIIARDFFKTQHTAITCSPKEIASAFPDVIWHTETPVLRTAPTPMMILSGSVRKNRYKVVVTGEGADEMFAGYNIFKEMVIRRFWARQPNSKIRPLLLTRLYPYIPHIRDNAQYLKFFFGYKLEETGSPFYSHLLRWANTSRLKGYFSEEINGELKGYEPLEIIKDQLPAGFNTWSSLAKAQWLEATIFMSGYLLSSQGDRMAMANSVEGRYPFLDHRVIEYAAKLSPELKLHGLTEKYILKKMMRGRLPEKILNRPKQAYRAPITSSFIQHEPEYLSLLLSKRTIEETGIFKYDLVSQLINKMKRGQNTSETDNMALTGIISTQLIHELYIRNKKPLNPEKAIKYNITTDNSNGQ